MTSSCLLADLQRDEGLRVAAYADPLSAEDLRSLMEFARSICVQIAAALDLRGRLPSPLGLRAAG